MTQLVHLILRFMGIVFGYFVACLTAAGIYAFLSGLITFQDFETYNDFEVYLALVFSVSALTFQFANIAWIPAFIIILIFELKSIKDWLYYLSASGLIAISILFSPFATPAAEDQALAYIVSAMGGGFIYWLFVGARAGKWRTKN